MDANSAWIEFPSSDRVFFTQSCTIGRGPTCQVILATERVSRRHALIRRTEGGTFEIMDMGSSNGTYVNGQRLSRPAVLRDGWIIEIGLQKMIFRTPPAPASNAEGEGAVAECWLLTLNATAHGARASSDDLLDKTFEAWGERCLRILQRHRAATTRVENDGWLAHWHDPAGATLGPSVLNSLKALRAAERPEESFRFALDFGAVTLRPGPAGVAAPSGAAIIHVIQIARHVRAAAVPLLISESAAAILEPLAPLRSVRAAELHGYRGSEKLFTLREEAES